MPDHDTNSDDGWVRNWPKGRRVRPIEKADNVSFVNATLVRIERLERRLTMLCVVCALLIACVSLLAGMIEQ